MIGSGQYGEQTLNVAEALPSSSVVTANADQTQHSVASPSTPVMSSLLILLAAAATWFLPQL
jgi:hypothetical protein